MPYVLIRHRVGNYAKWKRAFDAHGAVRRTHGSKGGRLFRSAKNPREVLLLLRWNDLRGARRFVKSADLRKAMKNAGVKGRPEISFLEERARPTA
jgi:heme-degrading monooxygenase HmoA